MPWGDWVNELPTEFFLAVHITAFAIGAAFAWTAFKRDLTLLGWAFSLFALAELTYMTYHLDWTVFLFAHTISESSPRGVHAGLPRCRDAGRRARRPAVEGRRA